MTNAMSAGANGSPSDSSRDFSTNGSRSPISTEGKRSQRWRGLTDVGAEGGKLDHVDRVRFRLRPLTQDTVRATWSCVLE